MKALRERKGREASGRLMVEGEVMIREALKCGMTIHDMIAEDDLAALAEELKELGARTCLAPRSLLESVSDTRTPQGICASFDIPLPLPLESAPKRIVALDGTQDPGNVGTIWRTADAAGFQAVLFGGGCADPLSPKVQRAAMGSGFRLPFMISDDLPGTLDALRSMDWAILASDLRGENFYNRHDPGQRFVLVIGNESRGISQAVRCAATNLVRLPMRGGAESLNAAVAAGIMMYELTRRLPDHTQSSSDDWIGADSF